MKPPRILYVQYFNPGSYPPLEHGARILARSGAEILVLGINAALGAEKLQWISEPRIRVLRLSYRAPGWAQKVHYILFAGWTLFHALLFRPAFIYGSDWLACPILELLSPFWKVVYHEHDVPLAALEINPARQGDGRGVSRFVRYVLRSRIKVANSASFCLAPNEGRAAVLRNTTGTKRPILSVWNCPTRDEVVNIDQDVPRSDRIVLFYHGSIVPERPSFAVLTAVAKLSGEVCLRIAGYETIGYPGYSDVLKRRVAELGITEYVDFLGPMPRRDLLAQCRLADVGLATFPSTDNDINHQTMAGASNKPFDYLACGLALLVGDLEQWRELFVSPGYGLACDASDAVSVAGALQWFCSNRQETSAMGRRGQARIWQEWNYETQFAEARDRLLGFVETT